MKIILLNRLLYWVIQKLPTVHEHSNTVDKQPISERITVTKPIRNDLGHTRRELAGKSLTVCLRAGQRRASYETYLVVCNTVR